MHQASCQCQEVLIAVLAEIVQEDLPVLTAVTAATAPTAPTAPTDHTYDQIITVSNLFIDHIFYKVQILQAQSLSVQQLQILLLLSYELFLLKLNHAKTVTSKLFIKSESEIYLLHYALRIYMITYCLNICSCFLVRGHFSEQYCFVISDFFCLVKLEVTFYPPE